MFACCRLCFDYDDAPLLIYAFHDIDYFDDYIDFHYD